MSDQLVQSPGLDVDSATDWQIEAGGKFHHGFDVNILQKNNLRSALIAVTYNSAGNPNFTRTDLLLLSVRPELFSPSKVVMVSSAQFDTGVKGEITNVTYSLKAPEETLNAILTAKVENSGQGGTYTVRGFQLA